MCQITPHKSDLHYILTCSKVQQLSNNTTKQRQQFSPTPLHVQHKKKITSGNATTERYHLDDWLTVHRTITLDNFQLDAQSSFLTGAQDSHLQRVTIPEAAYIQLRRRPPEDKQGNARNM
jgi:hypothetical protein